MGLPEENRPREAILNEVTGILFEYLTGAKLARLTQLENRYHQNIAPTFKDLLGNYQNILFQKDNLFYQKIQLFADQMASDLFEKFGNLQDIQLIGKFENQSEGEGDLLVIVKDQKKLISLKLIQEGSFINCKSGGVQSYFFRYFKKFGPPFTKESWSETISRHFLKFKAEVYSFYDLDDDLDFSEYRKSGHSELPGKLPLELRPALKHYYHQSVSELYKVMKVFYDQNPSLFLKCLRPLMGLSREEVVQAIFYYRRNGGELLPARVLFPAQLIERSELLTFGRPKVDRSSFELIFSHCRFQVRVKPMATFTQQGLKINHSLKF